MDTEIFKTSVFDAHDRLQHFVQTQSNTIVQGIEDCLKKNEDAIVMQKNSPYIYIFAHPRTLDDGATKKMFWQPRISKPLPQTNSYLFRIKSNTQEVEICWMLPPRELWPQYKKGNVTENDLVNWSISMFETKREELAQPHPEDLPEETQGVIFKKVMHEIRKRKLKPNLLGPSSLTF